jgi:16S rRNA (guanine966-N2)-methyltransferase
MGKIRIIGGTYRSRLVRFKTEAEGLRPTPDRVRESLFNWLGQDLTGKTCLDLFAGSGALGFEAASRNAKQVIMVEKNPSVVKDLRLNQELLRVNNLEIVRQDALAYLTMYNRQFEVIFLDPPYSSNLLTSSLQLLNKVCRLKPDGLIYIEYETMPDLTNYSIIKQGKAGTVNYALIKPKPSCVDQTV